MRKFRAISLNNVEIFLNAQVKEKLETYRSSCAQTLTYEFRKKERRLRPISSNFIKVMGKGRRAVAILDPESSMVVKLYSSMKNAYSVFLYLEKLGHKSGCKALDEKSFIALVSKSSASSDKRFFGYQWLLMDNLRSKRKVKNIADEQNLSNDMKALKPIPFVSKEVGFGLTASGSTKYMKLEKIGAGVPLALFQSFELAAADWFECYKIQLRDNQPLPENWREIFQTQYLDTELTVDGIVWRCIQDDQSSSVERMESG